MGMLEGRVAICTGAARGVGAEVAKMMAAHGAKIVVVDPGVGGAGEGGDTRPAQGTVDEIKAAGGEAVANFGSITNFDDCLKMVQQARDTFGGLHIFQYRNLAAQWLSYLSFRATGDLYFFETTAFIINRDDDPYFLYLRNFYSIAREAAVRRRKPRR